MSNVNTKIREFLQKTNLWFALLAFQVIPTPTSFEIFLGQDFQNNYFEIDLKKKNKLKFLNTEFYIYDFFEERVYFLCQKVQNSLFLFFQSHFFNRCLVLFTVFTFFSTSIHWFLFFSSNFTHFLLF